MPFIQKQNLLSCECNDFFWHSANRITLRGNCHMCCQLPEVDFSTQLYWFITNIETNHAETSGNPSSSPISLVVYCAHKALCSTKLKPKRNFQPACIYLTCPNLVGWPRGLPPISRMQRQPGRRWRFRLTHSIFTVCKELRRRVRNTGSDTGCTLCICASIHPDGGGMFPALTA